MSTAGDGGKICEPSAPRRCAPSTSRIPIPRPVESLEKRLDRYRDPRRRRAQSLLLWPLEKPRADRRSLSRGAERRRPLVTR